jgi:hypothetical protein
MQLAGKWKSDGSDDPTQGGKATTWNSTTSTGDDAGAELITVHSNSGSPSNFMYELVAPATRLFFQVVIVKKEKGSISVGVVTLPKFKAGYGLKAMLYNGNLTNGMSALKTNFGPYLKDGDKIVLEYIESDDNIQVIYHVNGECIGTGFQIAKENTPFYPCFSTTGNVELQVEILAEAPETSAAASGNDDPFDGKYEILEALDRLGEKIIPVTNLEHPREGKAIELSISHHHDDLWSFNVKVFNSLSIRKRFTTRKTPSDFILKDTGHGAMFLVLESEDQNVISSRMKPPPPYDQIERKLAACMANTWNSTEVSENGKTLTIFSGENKPIMICIRHEPKLGRPALTSY